MYRIGIRVQDLFDENILRQKVEAALEFKNQVLVKIYNRRAIEVDEVVEELLAYAERLRPMVADTSLVLEQALNDGKTVLFEAGQATLLDVDHGTYPFVTSSNATARRRVHRLRHPADAHRPGHRDPQGLHDPGRRGAVPDRAARRRRASSCARRARSTARRPAARAAAAGSTPWSAATPPGSTASPTSSSPSSTCSPGSTRCRSASPTTSTACATTRCRSTRPTSTTPTPVYEELDGWWEDISAVPHLRGAARQRPGLRAAGRGAHRRPGLGHRRRALPRRDDQPALAAG